MGRVSDVRGKPGDIVLVRGGEPLTVWRTIWNQVDRSRSGECAGTVMPTSLGIIIGFSSDHPSMTYVLWSIPCIAGWVTDGFLRPVKSE